MIKGKFYIQFLKSFCINLQTKPNLSVVNVLVSINLLLFPGSFLPLFLLHPSVY